MGMLKKYKRQAKNTKEEIAKFEDLDKVKASEIRELTEEIAQLQEIRQTNQVKYAQKFDKARAEKEHNTAIIKRQDKLMVDLQQKNEVCQITIAANEETVQLQHRDISSLDMRLREIGDKRGVVNKHISQMQDQISLFRKYKLIEMRKTKDCEMCVKHVKQQAADAAQSSDKGRRKAQSGSRASPSIG